MLNSVWLKDLIIKMLSDASSSLFQHYKVLFSNIKIDKCHICLFEPDFTDEIIILVNKKSANLISKENIQFDLNIIENIKLTRDISIQDNKVYCPLYFNNIAVFGFLYFEKNISIDFNDNFKQSLVSFAYCIYSESMGSLISSYHKTILKAENLSIDYKSGKLINHAVKKVNFDICEKEFTLIVGSSGSGKSTILNVLGGMLTPTSGSVYYEGEDISNFNEKEKTKYRCDNIGYIFQKYNLISGLTVEENIKIASSLVKNPLSCDEVLEMVGLKDKAKAYPSQLSGGEQQRVCIARALVKKASVLLCDEPTGALDSKNSIQIITLLQNISKERNIPVVVITHNPSLVVLADHCITLSNGEIIEDLIQPFALNARNLELR